MNCRVGLDICCTHKKLRLSFQTTAVYTQTMLNCQTKICSLFAHFFSGIARDGLCDETAERPNRGMEIASRTAFAMTRRDYLPISSCHKISVM